MKKTIVSIILIVIILAVVGYIGYLVVQKMEENEMYKSKLVKTKDDVIFEFRSNPTTGYGWTYTIDGESLVFLDDEYMQDRVEENMVGVGGTHTFVFKPKAKGYATVTFKYTRPFETDTEATYEIVYILEIDENMQTKLVSSIGEYFTESLPVPQIVK